LVLIGSARGSAAAFWKNNFHFPTPFPTTRSCGLNPCRKQKRWLFGIYFMAATNKLSIQKYQISFCQAQSLIQFSAKGNFLPDKLLS